MLLANQSLDTTRPRCALAATCAQIIDAGILNRVNEHTTQEQFQAAQRSIMQLRDAFAPQADWRHYAGIGGHCCVTDICTQASFLVQGLAITHQQAVPEQPRQQLITREGIVSNVEAQLHTSTVETDVGTDAQLPDIRRGG
jgi:hypothetical protein